jgi:hypothetical protein
MSILNPFKSDPHAEAAKHRARIPQIEAQLASITGRRTAAAEQAATAAAEGEPFDLAGLSAIDAEQATLTAALAVLRDRLAAAEQAARAADLAKLDADLLRARATAADDRATAAGALLAAAQLLAAAGMGRDDAARLLDAAPIKTRDPIAALRLRAAALGRNDHLVLVERDTCGTDRAVVEAQQAARRALSKIAGVPQLLAAADRDEADLLRAREAATAAAARRAAQAQADLLAVQTALRDALRSWPSSAAWKSDVVAVDPAKRQAAHDLIGVSLERLGAAELTGEVRAWHRMVEAAADRLNVNDTPRAANLDRLRPFLGLPVGTVTL